MSVDLNTERPNPYYQIAETAVEKSLIETVLLQGYAELCRSPVGTEECHHELNARFKDGRLPMRLIILNGDEVYLRKPGE